MRGYLIYKVCSVRKVGLEMSQPCLRAQEHSFVRQNRTLATETSYSCLDAPFQAYSGATQWLETAAQRKTPLCCWFSGFLWYAAGALPEKCTSAGFWFIVFEVLQDGGFWKQHLYFLGTNLHVFVFYLNGDRCLTFFRLATLTSSKENSESHID